jgi:WD40 repeat protein
MMVPPRESITGAVGIVLLLAAALWYAADPDLQHWPLAAFPAGGASRQPLPEITVTRLDWSADGRILLSRSRGVVEGAESVTLHTLSPSVLQSPVDLRGQTICAAALAPDGHHLVLGTYAKELWWIDCESSESPALVELPSGLFINSVAVSSDSCRIAAASTSGRIYVCEPVRRSVVELRADRDGNVCDLQFSCDGSHLVSSRADGTISVWDVVSGGRLQSFSGHGKPVQVAAFLPDNERIISGGFDDSVRIWNIATGREEWRGEFGMNGVRALDVSPDGTTAAWGGFDSRIIVWDLRQRYRRFELRTAAVFVSKLKFSPDSRTLAVGGMDRMIRLFDVQTGAERPGIDLTAIPHSEIP